MMTLISNLSESVFIPIVLRTMSLVTVVLLCACLLSCIAGTRNAALRSHVWTTSLVLLLVIPLLSILCERQKWELISLPIHVFQSADVAEPEKDAKGTSGADNATGVQTSEFKNSKNSSSDSSDALQESQYSGLVMSADEPVLVVASSNQPIDDRPGNVFKMVASLLIAAWAIGVAIGLGRIAIAILHVNRLLRSVDTANPARLDCIASQVCRTLGLTSLPRIVESPTATTAAAAYYRFHAQVILPDKMLTELSDSELKDVVTHECAHLLRYDPLVGLLQSVAVILYCPNPLIYLARRELTRAREEVCDNYALQGTDPVGYAKTLLHIAEQGVMGTSLVGVASLSSNFWQLEDRIQGILDEDRSTKVSVGRFASIWIASILGLVAVLGGFARFGSAQQEPNAENQIAPADDTHEAWHPSGVVVLGEERGRKWSLASGGFDVRPDGKQIAAGSHEGRIFLWNATTMRLERILSAHDGQVHSVHYSPDGSKLISIGEDKKILSWDLSVEGEPQSETIASVDDNPYGAVWSSDGSSVSFLQKIWRFSRSTELTNVATIPKTPKENRELPDDIKSLAKTLKGSYIVRTNGLFPIVLSAGGDQAAISSGGSRIWINATTEQIERFVDSTVTVWRIVDGEPQKRFEIHDVGFVYAMAFSQDGKTLAIGGHDNKTRLFDIENDSPRATYVLDHDATVQGLCFDPMGQTLAVATDKVQLWDMRHNPPLAGRQTPILRLLMMSPLELSFSSDGTTLFYLDRHLVRRWEVAGPYIEQTGEKEMLNERPRELAVAFTDKQLYSVNDSNDGSEIFVRDFTDLKADPKNLIPRVDGRISDLSFSKDERQFVFSVSRHPNYSLQLWQQTPEGPKLLDIADLKTGYPGSFWCAAFSPDGRTLATGHRDGAIRLWGISNGSLTLIETERNVHQGGVSGLDYSPDGKLLASVDQGGIVTLWEMKNDAIEMTCELGAHRERAYRVRFSPDGRLLATAGNEGSIKLWAIGADPAETIDLNSHTAGVASLEFDWQSKHLLSSCYDGQVIVWDLVEKKPIREWQFPGNVLDAKLDPTGRKIVTANGNGSIYVWAY